MSLNGRIARLERELSAEDDEGPDLAQRLANALIRARERQRLGLPRPEPPEGDDPLSRRLRQAWEQAEELRRQSGGGDRPA
jgi:hypothetical protein